jgi:hypothetical protein
MDEDTGHGKAPSARGNRDPPAVVCADRDTTGPGPIATQDTKERQAELIGESWMSGRGASA